MTDGDVDAEGTSLGAVDVVGEIVGLVELPTPTGGGSPLAATNSSGYGEGPIARQATRKQITGELDIEPQKVV